MAESYIRGQSNSPIGSSFESYKFKNDVMFSSASISEPTGGYSTSAGGDEITTKSLMYTGESMEFTDRLTSSMSEADIKQEPLSDEDDGEKHPSNDTFYQSSSQGVFPDMMTSPAKNVRDFGMSSVQSEISQNNVEFVIKQEPLTDEDDGNKNDERKNEVFGEYLLKSDDIAVSAVGKDSMSGRRRSKRQCTGKRYDDVYKEYDSDSEDSDQFETELKNKDDNEEYAPSIYIEQEQTKKNSKTKKHKKEENEKQPKTTFSFENLKGNTLNIEGTLKKLQVNIFRCPECDSIFTYESVLKKHMRKHSGDMPFKCKHCNLGFMTQFSHDLHSRIHTADKRYQCGICGKKMKLKKDLKEHNVSHVLTKTAQELSSNLKLNAEKDEKFANTSNLSGNEKYSNVEFSPFGCSLCDFVAKDFAEIGNHMLVKHFVDRRCFCDICSRRFTNNDDLKLHKVQHNKQLREISCGICDEIVDSESDLMKHLDIHPEAKPYKCCRCGAKFIVLPQLQAHMSLHSFTKRYNCSFCEKQFFHEDTLESHLRVHTGEVAFKCEVCSKGFRVKDRLTRHLRLEHDLLVDPLTSVRYKVNASDSCVTTTGDTDNSRSDSVERVHALVQQEAVTSSEPNDANDQDTCLTSTAHPPDWEKDLGCKVDISGSNSYLHQLKNRLKKKLDESTWGSFSGNENDYLQTIVKVEGGVCDEEGVMTNEDGHANCEESAVNHSTNLSESLEKQTFNSKWKSILPRPILPDSNIRTVNESPNVFDSVGKQDSEAKLNIKVANVDNKSPVAFERIGKQRFDAKLKETLSTGDTGMTGTPFSIAVKKLTTVLPSELEDTDTVESTGLNKTAGFTQMEKTMQLQMNIHQCKVCGAMFAYNNMLQKHMKKHTGQEPFRCEECNRGFMSKSTLKAHSRVHSGEKPYSCDICHRSFRQKSGLSYHKRTHSTPFGCSLCTVCEGDEDSIVSHVSTEHFQGCQHVCEVCGQRFDVQPSLQQHLGTHDTCLTLVCSICGNKYEDKIKLQIHLNSHTRARPFRCVVCNATFRSVSELSSHLDTHKATEHVLQCSLCTMAFMSKQQLLSHHKYRHKNEFDLNSTVIHNSCGDDSATESPTEKTFPCKFCDQVFSSGVQRWAHSATHTNARPYSCSICGKGYINKGSLATHEVTHNIEGSNTFNCPTCGEKFKKKLALIRHCKAQHESSDGKSPTQVSILRKKLTKFDDSIESMISSSRTETKDHAQELQESPEFKCSNCEETSTSELALERHCCKTVHRLSNCVSSTTSTVGKLDYAIDRDMTGGSDMETDEDYAVIKTEALSADSDDREDTGLSSSACVVPRDVLNDTDGGMYIKSEPLSTGYGDLEINGQVSQSTSGRSGDTHDRTEAGLDDEDIGQLADAQEEVLDTCNMHIKSEPMFTGYGEIESHDAEGEFGHPAVGSVREDLDTGTTPYIKSESLSTEYGHMETKHVDDGIPRSCGVSNEGGHTSTPLDQHGAWIGNTTTSGPVMDVTDPSSIEDNGAHVCPTCGKRCIDLRNLEIHKRSHVEVTETVEIICTECGADFCKKSHLKKHIKKHHNETNKQSFRSKLKKIKVQIAANSNQ